MSIVKDFVLIAFMLTITLLFLTTLNDITLFVLIIVTEAYILKKYIGIKKELDKEREYFIKTLSHDIRVSTIAQIRGLEYLEKNSNSNKELILDINNSCKYTLEMITMLLNTYRYKSGEEVLNYENFSLKDCIKTSISLIHNLAQEKNIQLHSDITAEEIEADKDELVKAFKILISTAISNSRINSKISIKIKKETNNYRFIIIYKGKNLSEEECKRMFSKNPRFSTVGHGIKMYLCKNIVEFHGGKIYVQNLKKDYNAFIFTIPVSRKEQNIKPAIISALQPN